MDESCKNNEKITRKPAIKASEEHKQLSKFIKDVHLQLRSDCEKHGASEAWKTHTLQEEKLKNYAQSMYQLATQHWGTKSKEAPLSYCRIEWIKNQCKNYFAQGEMYRFDEKERHLMNNSVQESEKQEIMSINTTIEDKIKVLDVGSCYNPFNNDSLFSVTAIDIAPYSEDVIKCDFLNVKVGDKNVYAEDGDESLIEMTKSSYDAVIFSLLLEYIPCPKQRFLCCEKAYQLLRSGGLLLIVTPDSKHAGANTKVLNTAWKVVLAQLGFMRISYEKLQHVHCMTFRKCFYKESALKRINWNKIADNNELFYSSKMFIPQDFQTKKSMDENSNCSKKSVKHSDEELLSLFNELPCEL